MARREFQPFNLSLLDLLTSALGAIIFLFIITPKGGAPPAPTQQIAAYIDTVEHQVFGLIPDSLRDRQIGDTLRIVLVDYKNFPKEQPQPKPVAEQPKPVPVRNTESPRTERPEPREPQPKVEEKTPERQAPVAVNPDVQSPPKPPVYRGDAPSVPCVVSFEIKWLDAGDNVDLFVCKDGDCVYGGRKRDYGIGQWDSGKSRNRLFGNDLRTNQEAVRQFDKIVPGTYQIYAQFKNSEKERTSVLINGLIYTKNASGQERGDEFAKTISLSDDRVLIGRGVIREDGSFSFN
jgi:hypothetical protein